MPLYFYYKGTAALLQAIGNIAAIYAAPSLQSRCTESVNRQKEGNKYVNIFQQYICFITLSLPTHCKTYCFTFQKRRFCTVKAAVLQGKTAAFATPKRSYHFLRELSLQNQGTFSICLKQEKDYPLSVLTVLFQMKTRDIFYKA